MKWGSVHADFFFFSIVGEGNGMSLILFTWPQLVGNLVKLQNTDGMFV